MAALSGLRIAVTRAAAQAAELAAPLRERGASVITTPLIRIEPRMNDGAVRDAVARLGDYAWIVFTSANGVDLFAQAVRQSGQPLAAVSGAVACVGPATAAAARRHGLEVSVIPAEYVGHVIAEALAERAALTGRQILLARAEGAGAELPARLRASGAVVTDIHLYRSGPDLDGAHDLRAHLTAGTLDVLTFTSGSTVRYFGELVGVQSRAWVAVIGPVTAEAARNAGLNVDVVAEPHTVDGLVSAIAGYFEEKRK